MRRLQRHAALTALAAVGALGLAACGGGGDGGDGGAGEEVAEDEFEEAMSTPTELTFWTWVPDIENQVDMFMEEYPEIDVEVVNVGQGADHYQQLRTAIEAGSGAPDVTQIEFQHLSSFRLGENLLDLTPYVGDLEGMYPEWVWTQVSQDDGLWAIPQDTGPMGHLFREDLFEEAGIEVPTTWEEYAEAARTYREAKPDSYITNMPGNDPGQFVGLLWQAGARPFGYDGQETVTIDLDTPEVEKVVQYWDDLISEDLVSVDPDFTDQWYQGLANGKYAGWVTAAWGPVFLQGTAGNTSGLWGATEMPQWEGGDQAGNWGGSTDAVLASTENPIAAAELARWINVEQEPAMRFAQEQFLFPASTEILEAEEFLSQEAEFYGGEQVNALFAEISEGVATDFGWLPFMDYAYSAFGETLGSAIADRGDLMQGLQDWEADLVEYAESQGFTVE
ncbi:extracellular solute-binding protein [Actinotalea sp. Marseille-Q4924]|uniref:extracellular solute-binding protein n=1 Tax=Actinotalea sp. Marseille-Q4924 TaxID=2866571 RepID=UPI001CE480AA|nr:extracellular solute-binding protein [Actinotalea sp. Marseille-Q4924]